MGIQKIARVRLSLKILEDILKGDFDRWAGESSAPEDLEVLGVDQPAYALGQWCYVICRSNTFTPLPEGSEIPEIEPFIFTRKE